MTLSPQRLDKAAEAISHTLSCGLELIVLPSTPADVVLFVDHARNEIVGTLRWRPHAMLSAELTERDAR